MQVRRGLGTDPELAHLLVERVTADPEQLRGLGSTETGLPESPQDQLALHIRHGPQVFAHAHDLALFDQEITGFDHAGLFHGIEF